MNKRIKTGFKNPKWIFKLNVQFSILVMLAIIISFVCVFVVASVIGTLVERNLNDWTESTNKELKAIEEEYLKKVDVANMVLSEQMTIPEIEELNEQYPGYHFDYVTVLNKSKQEVEATLSNYTISDSSYIVYVAEASNGVIVVGITIPEMSKWSVVVIGLVILIFMTVFSVIIGIFVGKKAKYLKLMTQKLETMAGGNLDTQVPIKGRNEISQVAWHINQMAKALHERIENEKSIERAKTQLIANISHDLRTPLTSVLGYLSLLQEDHEELQKEQIKHYIVQANSRAQDVSHLVDQLFDFVLISNRQMKPHYIQVNPSVFFCQLFDEMKDPLTNQNIAVKVQFDQCEKLLLVDVQQFKRIADNLFLNIQKYSVTDAMVEIKGNCTSANYTIQVTNRFHKDECLNTEELLNQYFTTDRVSGKSSGLGLTICKEIVEQHGGKLFLSLKDDLFTVNIELPLLREEKV